MNNEKENSNNNNNKVLQINLCDDNIELENKVINFKIQGEEYTLINKSVLNILNPLLKYISKYYDKHNNCYCLPKNIEKYFFELFLNFLEYLNTDIPDDTNDNISKLNDTDSFSLRKVIDICFFFNSFEIMDLIIKKIINPKLTKEFCLDIIINFIDLLYIQKTKNLFINLIEECLNISAKNLMYLIDNKPQELFNLQEETIDEIIEIYFKFYMSFNKNDIDKIIDLLIYNRKINKDIYELLENERKKAISSFEKQLNHTNQSSFINNNNNNNYTQISIDPTLSWNIKIDLNENQYNEEEITFDNLIIILIIYFDAKNDNFNLAFQIKDAQIPSYKRLFNNNNYYYANNNNNSNIIINSNFNSNGCNINANNNSNITKITNSKDYFINNIHCNSENNQYNSNINNNKNSNLNSIATNNNNNNVFYSNNNNNYKNYYYSENNKNNATINIKNNEKINFFLSLLSIIDIPELKFKSKINFNCIHSEAKSKILLFKIDNFIQNLKSSNLNNTNNNSNIYSFNLNIYLLRNYTFSSLLDYLCQYFSDFITLKSIRKLPKILLNLILKNKNNNNIIEQQLLVSILNWLANKNTNQIKSSMDLFANINWNLIDSNTLIDLIMIRNEIVNTLPQLKDIIFSQLQKREKKQFLNNLNSANTSNLTESFNSNINDFNNININNNDVINSKSLNDILNRIVYNSSQFVYNNKCNNENNIYNETDEINKDKYKKINYTSPNDNKINKNKIILINQHSYLKKKLQNNSLNFNCPQNINNNAINNILINNNNTGNKNNSIIIQDKLKMKFFSNNNINNAKSSSNSKSNNNSTSNSKKNIKQENALNRIESINKIIKYNNNNNNTMKNNTNNKISTININYSNPNNNSNSNKNSQVGNCGNSKSNRSITPIFFNNKNKISYKFRNKSKN